MTRKKITEWVNKELENEFPGRGCAVKEIYRTRYRANDYENGAYKMYITAYYPGNEIPIFIYSGYTMKELTEEIKRTNGRLAIDWGKTRWKNRDPLLEVIK